MGSRGRYVRRPDRGDAGGRWRPPPRLGASLRRAARLRPRPPAVRLARRRPGRPRARVPRSSDPDQRRDWPNTRSPTCSSASARRSAWPTWMLSAATPSPTMRPMDSTAFTQPPRTDSQTMTAADAPYADLTATARPTADAAGPLTLHRHRAGCPPAARGAGRPLGVPPVQRRQGAASCCALLMATSANFRKTRRPTPSPTRAIATLASTVTVPTTCGCPLTCATLTQAPFP